MCKVFVDFNILELEGEILEFERNGFNFFFYVLLGKL